MLLSESVSEIEIYERLEALYNILRSKQQKYIYDLLSVSRLLRYLRGAADCPIPLFNRCICVQTLSYLAHYRTSNDGSALPFQVFSSKLLSNNGHVIKFLLRANLSICWYFIMP